MDANFNTTVDKLVMMMLVAVTITQLDQGNHRHKLIQMHLHDHHRKIHNHNTITITVIIIVITVIIKRVVRIPDTVPTGSKTRTVPGEYLIDISGRDRYWYNIDRNRKNTRTKSNIS